MGEAEARWVMGPAPPPADADGASAEMVWATEGRGLHVVALGSAVQAMWVHWSDGRSCPCVGAAAACPYCQVKDREWQGYFAAWCLQRGRPVCVVLRTVLGREVLRVAQEHGHLRGLEMRMSVGGRGKKRWAKAEVVRDHGASAALRAGFDLRPTYDRVFGVGEWRLATGEEVRGG